MNNSEYITKDLCNERSTNIIKSVEGLNENLKNHYDKIDITIAEIFKLIKERNNKDAYNKGFIDGNKSKYNMNYKLIILIITAINAILLGIIEILKAAIK